MHQIPIYCEYESSMIQIKTRKLALEIIKIELLQGKRTDTRGGKFRSIFRYFTGK